jgi:RimJ/RimL family protein N-acetyltransferase
METERLILRPIEEEDAPALHPLINDPDVAHTLLTVPHPYPEDKLVPWIRGSKQALEKKERFEMTIILKETGLPIGMCGFCQVSWEYLNAEMGYWLGKPYWGRGYMTEAVRRLLVYGFEELGFERIYAQCFDLNPASVRVLEKAGLKHEGCARRAVRKNGEFIDLLNYGMIRADYDALCSKSAR